MGIWNGTIPVSYTHLKVTAEIAQGLPKGMELVDLMSSKDFLDASIKNVIKTLIEAILLVVLVVYVFLQNLRSTFIPAISIIVSLVGTFAFLYAAGFSLNMLTLFALVLVIGTVAVSYTHLDVYKRQIY